MTALYLIILCLALVTTLASVAAWLYDASRVRAGRRDGEQPGGQWYDGALDRVLVMFSVAGAGLLLGLLVAGEEVDLVGLGTEAMLIAAGVTGGERLAARRSGAGGGHGLPPPAALLVAAGAGLVGGLAGLGG